MIGGSECRGCSRVLLCPTMHRLLGTNEGTGASKFCTLGALKFRQKSAQEKSDGLLRAKVAT